jgi:hypothetical protein
MIFFILRKSFIADDNLCRRKEANNKVSLAKYEGINGFDNECLQY